MGHGLARIDADFSLVYPLFAPLMENLVVESVLDGHTRGRVYVDDPAAPRVALLWTLLDTVLLAGAPEARLFPALRRLLRAEMWPDARARGVPFFTLTPDRAAWAAHLPALLPGAVVEPVPRLAFRLAARRVDWRAALPAGMRLQPLDAAFLARRALPNMDQVRGWVLSFWEDEAAFARRGLGFAVLDGAAVASWA
ncbi:MAG: GNAT family N-acetyltransferase, partial [Anaerolineales bacterium]|nr:GNAT family N-acetyltransferase [Anaerolineales bacterium]